MTPGPMFVRFEDAVLWYEQMGYNDQEEYDYDNGRSNAIKERCNQKVSNAK